MEKIQSTLYGAPLKEVYLLNSYLIERDSPECDHAEVDSICLQTDPSYRKYWIVDGNGSAVYALTLYVDGTLRHHRTIPLPTDDYVMLKSWMEGQGMLKNNTMEDYLYA